jgi:hypothetical protein
MGKAYCLIILLFLSINSLAQDSGSSHKDTVRKFIGIVDAKQIHKHQKLLYVIDDKIYYGGSLNPSYLPDSTDILDVKILKGDEAMKKYGQKGGNGAIIIVGRRFAICQYQKRLGAFSEEYKKYIESQMKYNPNNDGILSYSIDDNMPFLKGDELTRELYDLPAEKIASVKLTVQQTCCGINRWVNINTKR